MEPCAFDKLYTRNVPHILEKIFFSLDYKSFKTCLNVNETWHKLLSSEAFQKRAKSVFHEEISNDEKNLWNAASKNNVEKVMSLLSTGLLNINVVNRSWNTTPLHIAAKNGHKNIVKLLLERGARHDKPDNFAWYPLHRAAQSMKPHNQSRQKDVVQMLLNAGAHIDQKNHCGATVLHIAASCGGKDMVRLLLDRGANPNTANDEGFTPLQQAALEGQIDVNKLLLERGADPHRANNYGNTPLHYAATLNRKEVVKLLIENGADVNAADRHGHSPLHRAREKDVFQLLIDNGADPSMA